MHILPLRSIAPLMLGVLLLSACIEKPSAPTATASPPGATRTEGPTPTAAATPIPPIQIDPASLRGVEIQLWDAFAGSSSDAFATQVAQFNSSNQWGIVVTPTDYGDYTSLFEAVNAGLASGTGPELVVALPEQELAWDASQSIVDLTRYVGDPVWGLKSGASSDFPAAFWTQDVVDSRRIGLPAQRSARFLFYNETWARQLGFDHPPATSDEFRQQACAANASLRSGSNPQVYGYGGWIVDTTWQTTLSWMQAFSGGVLAGTTYHFQSDQNLAALQFLKKLYDDHCAWISTGPNVYDPFANRLALFVSGDLAEVPQVIESLSRLKNSDEWTVIPFPGPQTSALVGYGPSYSLLTSTPEKQLAAWLFVRWVLSTENQVQWVEATGSLPLLNSAVNALGDYQSKQPQWAAAVEAMPKIQEPPPLASWRQVRYVLEDGVQSIFRTNVSVDQIPAVLAEIDAMAEELSK